MDLDINVNLAAKRVVRENNTALLQRTYTWTEGEQFTGEIKLVGTAVVISKTVVSLGDATNSLALAVSDRPDGTYSLSITGQFVRNYLYNAPRKRTLLNITLTVGGTDYIIQPVAVELIAAPDENTVSVSVDDVAGLEAALALKATAGDLDAVEADLAGKTAQIGVLTDGKVDKIAGKGLSEADFSAAEKSKLAGIEAGAQANAVASVAGKTGAVTLTKADVGLSNVDNTLDTNKPISTAAQAALDALSGDIDDVAGTADQLAADVVALEASVDSLNSAVGTIGTTAGDAASAIAGHTADTDNPHAVTKAQVGLGNADDTADTDKPLSTAAQTALAGKADLVAGKVPEAQLPAMQIVDVFEAESQAEMLALSTAGQGDVCVRSDVNKTFILRNNNNSDLASWVELPTPTQGVASVNGRTGSVTLSKSDVDLDQVDNTPDMSKPVSTAQATALAGKSNIGHTHAMAEIPALISVLNAKPDKAHNHYSADILANEFVVTLAGTAAVNGTYIPTGSVGVTGRPIFSNGVIECRQLEVSGSALEGGTLIPRRWIFTDGSTEYYTVTSDDQAIPLTGWAVATGGTAPAPVVTATRLETVVARHASKTDNPHAVTKAQVGLGDVDNTSDANKPVSTATQAALDGKAATTHTHAISDVTSLQSALDDKVDKVVGKGLSEAEFTSTEKSKLAGIEAGAQANTLVSVAGKTGAVTLAKADVGLDQVDNTPDASKPVSTAQAAAIVNSIFNAFADPSLVILRDDFLKQWASPATNGSIGELGWAIGLGTTTTALNPAGSASSKLGAIYFTATGTASTGFMTLQAVTSATVMAISPLHDLNYKMCWVTEITGYASLVCRFGFHASPTPGGVFATNSTYIELSGYNWYLVSTASADNRVLLGASPYTTVSGYSGMHKLIVSREGNTISAQVVLPGGTVLSGSITNATPAGTLVRPVATYTGSTGASFGIDYFSLVAQTNR